MRLGVIAAFVLAMSSCAFAQPSRSTALAHLPEGAVSESVYTNDAAGVIFPLPTGWIVAPNSEEPVILDLDPNGLANLCSRILLRYEAPGKVEGKFVAWGVLLAIDPGCLSAGPFPRSMKDKDKIQRAAKEVVDSFKHSPFFPPDGVDISATLPEGEPRPVIVILEGHGTLNLYNDDPAHEKKFEPVSTLFVVTEAPPYWIAWAAVVDDASKNTLQSSKIQIRAK